MSSDSWFYAAAGVQQIGPLSSAVLRQMLAGGQLAWTDYVWREGMEQWQAAQDVPELSGPGGVEAAPLEFEPEAAADAEPPYAQPAPLGYQQPYHPPTYSDATSHYQTKFRGSGYADNASTAFTLSIVGLFCVGFILGPIALAMGISALRGMRRSRTETGQGLAIAAVVIGGLETLGTLLLIAALVVAA